MFFHCYDKLCCFAASIGSAGYGNVSAGATSGQRLDEYPYMTPLYPAMNGKTYCPFKATLNLYMVIFCSDKLHEKPKKSY